MHIMYQCVACGARAFEPGDCCGKPMESYRAGSPEKVAGAPMVIGDHLPRHFDASIGREVDSKSQRAKAYRDMGLNMNGPSDMKQRALQGKEGVTYSYKGQRNHG